MKTLEEIKNRIIELEKEKPVKWKIQSVQKKDKGGNCRLLCVCYYDARTVIDHLNEAFGFLGWQREHFRLDGKEYCRLKVFNPEGGDWVTFEETGSKSKTESGKGETSDSFKRAAVNVGIGRRNYDSETFYVNGKWGKTSDGKEWSYPVGENGKRVYDLTSFINNNLSKKDFGANKEVMKKIENNKNLLDDLERLGAEMPELLNNCFQHVQEKGFTNFDSAPKELLIAYVARLKEESEKNSLDEIELKPVK